MMTVTIDDVSDEQWCVLDLLMRARQKGIATINKYELLANTSLPQAARIKLAWAALTMPDDLIVWAGDHDFAITSYGVGLYELRFGRKDQKATPTAVADAVICLPGPEHYRN